MQSIGLFILIVFDTWISFKDPKLSLVGVVWDELVNSHTLVGVQLFMLNGWNVCMYVHGWVT
jgi:hypothetical protein